jgi:hypothetical protein
MTKIPLVALDKLHATLVTNDNEFWMKEKVKQNTPSSFDWLYMYCHLWLKCNYFLTMIANDVLPHVPSFCYFKYFKYKFEII